jgi:hypothetical protein
MFNTIQNNESIELRRILWPEKKEAQHKKIVANAEESLPFKQVSRQETPIAPECVFFAIELA